MRIKFVDIRYNVGQEEWHFVHLELFESEKRCSKYLLCHTRLYINHCLLPKNEFVIGIMKDLSVDHQSLEESVVDLSLFAILS